MAWVNVPLPIATGICNNDNIWNLSEGEKQQTSAYDIQVNPYATYSEIANNYWVFGDNTFGIYNQAGSTTNVLILYPSANSVNAVIKGNSDYSDITMCLGYNTSNNTGKILIYYTYKWNGRTYYNLTVNRCDTFAQYAYNNPPITYNWQSVPSISGKNGILSLAQIKEEYINDGESVSGASADHFTNLSTENRVDVLINDALPAPEIGGTTVTVKYTIPSLSTGSYEYCKLVAKKNSMPEGPEDGDKIIDIDPSLTSIVVRGLDGLSRYYFTIFIEDDQGNTASSEPKSCMTGESEWRDITSEVNISDVTQYSKTANFTETRTYDNGRNTVIVTTNSTYEALYKAFTVITNTDYKLSLDFNSDGLRIGDDPERIYITQLQPQNSGAGNWGIIDRIELPKDHAETDYHLELEFNSGYRTQIYIALGYYCLTDGYTYTLYYNDIKLYQRK